MPGLLEWPAAIAQNRETLFPAYVADYLPTILDLLGSQRELGKKGQGTAKEETFPFSVFCFLSSGDVARAASGLREKSKLFVMVSCGGMCKCPILCAT